ncbi:M48 family metallopeptidase [Thermocrispum municipale]|uniref:M48 family metallopeptidase n=1 Tax=Thermocrispum municipale TaxID=37926 RepID=UPI0004101DD6|nr:M48 family metallopeptidase [Thermocrispum municipale]
MNFFERQIQVRKASGRLVFLFVVAVIGIVAVIDLAMWGLLLREMPADQMVPVLLTITIVVLIIIACASLFRLASLKKGGGGKVARSLGGVYVPEDTNDPQLRRLRNVVEEIAIASGTPVPELYVLPHEPGINAFAAGWSPADAAVAVTRGTLERLNRDELQGVIAHEFSHVVNGDMRLSIRLMGVLFGILGLAVVGRVLMATRGQRNPLPAIGLVLWIAGGIGLLCGKLIKAAVSRQREYLADASAVQFTRQTEGIAGALKKIGGLPDGSELRSGKKDDVSHMLFGEGSKFAAMFATHPPLVERIRALQPHFNPAELEALKQRWTAAPPAGLQEDAAMGLAPAPAGQAPAAPPSGQPVAGMAPPPSGQPAAGMAPPAGAMPPPSGPPVPAPPPGGQGPAASGPSGQQGPIPVRPDQVVAGIGDPSAATYEHGENLLRRIPEEFKAKARRTDTVVPLIFGLLMSSHPEARQRQHQVLTQRHGKPLADAAWNEGGALQRLDADLRLPLSEIAFSALRRRSPQELQHIMGSLDALIKADGRVDVFEYCLSTLLHIELHEVMYHRPPWRKQRRTLANVAPSVAVLLAVLARVGHDDPRQGEAAFRAGLHKVLPGQQIPFQPPQQGLLALDGAWAALDGLEGNEKAALVESLVLVISHDGVMTTEEVELLRTVCAVLHCPVPPLSSAQQHPAAPAQASTRQS